MRVTKVTPWVQLRYSQFFSMPVCRYPITERACWTVSPSSSSTSRSTPCVDGCWGPMLMTMRSSCSSSINESQSPPVTV